MPLLQVTWWKGVTSPGSSGSPLIDLDTQRVVGVLTGGLSTCATPNLPDYFGRLSAARSLPIFSPAACMGLLPSLFAPGCSRPCRLTTSIWPEPPSLQQMMCKCIMVHRCSILPRCVMPSSFRS